LAAGVSQYGSACREMSRAAKSVSAVSCAQCFTLGAASRDHTPPFFAMYCSVGG
jgi:hypothetical protein